MDQSSDRYSTGESEGLEWASAEKNLLHLKNLSNAMHRAGNEFVELTASEPQRSRAEVAACKILNIEPDGRDATRLWRQIIGESLLWVLADDELLEGFIAGATQGARNRGF